MAEQIISPGVFTRENDLSFLPQGVGAIGAAIIGPTVKGPAFVPTVVRSFEDYERRFGPLSSETYIPQTVREYLRNAGSVTVCRVLAGGGYTFASSGTVIHPLGVLAGESTKAMSVFEVADGDAASGITAGQFITLKDQAGLIVEYVVTDTGGGGTATNTNDTAGALTVATDTTHTVNSTGTGATKACSVGIDITAANTQYVFITALFAAIEHANGHNGTIDAIDTTGGAAADGAQNVLFVMLRAGEHGNIEIISNNIANLTARDFSGGNDPVLTGLIYPSKVASGTPNLQTSAIDVLASLSSSNGFGVSLNNGIQSATEFTASLNPINTNYLFKYIGYTPNNSKTGANEYGGTSGYTHLNFKSLQTDLNSTGHLGAYTNGALYTGSSAYDNGENVADLVAYGSGSNVQFSLISAAGAEFNGNIAKTEGYGYATTPWIQSQIALGRKQLFRFHTLDHGDGTSRLYKISIANLREPADIDNEEQYSTFSVIIRKYNDTDKNPVILEQYNNCTLDPDSPRYISRMIGDRYPDYNETLDKVELKGNYPNVSHYIRVEADNAVEERSLSPKISPKGFKAIQNTFTSASLATRCIIPSASYDGVQQVGTDGVYNSKGYLGWKFKEKNVDNENFIGALPTLVESNIAGDFNVENYFGHADAGYDFTAAGTGSLSASVSTTGGDGPHASQLKFTVPFQDGQDGLAPWTVKQVGSYITADNLYGFDLDGTAKTGYKAYKKALDILSNQDEYDINMLAIPGVIKNLHSSVCNLGIDMCEERGDAFYVMDLTAVDASVNQAVQDVSGLDSNYAAVYYPWVKVLDTNKNKPTLVPPSVIVPGAIAASDRIAAEWFAPAGLNRGVLGNVIEAKIRLNQAERDTLYDSKINPIATFPQTGVCIWGQKTLQERSTALDRINVRRLLIALKKFIASSSKYLVFEQNTTATRNRFLNIVNPYLESVQQRQGLYAFRVVMDETNNTPTVIDRNQLVGAIYLQPTKTAEFIILDFNVLPTGATFPA